jgi:DMSO reductase anchor subunit
VSPRRPEQPRTSSYYGRPIIKEPTWAALDIAGYFFLGGLAGASSILAAGADATGRPELARPLKVAATGAIGLSLVALVHDLGRPERFLNMLRVLKPSSPMSVGVWLLSAYAPAAGVAALSDLTGRLPAIGRVATAGAAVLGPGVASYTSVLMANTAVPAWHEPHRQLPFVFVGSAASAAAGLGMASAPVAAAGPARRLAVLGTACELGASELMKRRVPRPVDEAYAQGSAGRLLHVSEALGVAGAVGALTVARRSRVGALASGLALLTASACTRFGLFEAGRASARDPRHTVEPQRARSA